jgi:hypothetical protein
LTIFPCTSPNPNAPAVGPLRVQFWPYDSVKVLGLIPTNPA